MFPLITSTPLRPAVSPVAAGPPVGPRGPQPRSRSSDPSLTSRPNPEHLSSVPTPAGLPSPLTAPLSTLKSLLLKATSPSLSLSRWPLGLYLPLGAWPSSSPSGPRLTTSISLGFHSRATRRAPQPSPGAPPDPCPRQPPASAPTPRSPLAAGAPKLRNLQPQPPLTSAVRVGLPRPTSESASEPPSESGALRASPEWSAPSGGGGARVGDPEWRRERWRLRAGIAPALVSDRATALKPNRNCFRRRGPAGGRRSPMGGGGAQTGRGAGLKMQGGTSEEHPGAHASGPKREDKARGDKAG